MYCNSCGNKIDERYDTCPNCGMRVKNVSNVNTVSEYVPQKPLGMKWYNFIIWVQLPLSVILSIWYSIKTFAGTKYSESYFGNMTWDIYREFDGLQALDIFDAVITLLLAGFMIYVRILLAKYKEEGPKMLYIMSGICIVLNIFLFICYVSIAQGTMRINSFLELDMSAYNSTFITTIIKDSIFLWIDVKYFTKRRHLFTN